MIAKDDAVRSKKLREAARGESCVNCNDNDETTVMCHLPFPGDAGRGIKTDDYWSAHLCWSCHVYADSAEGRRDYSWRGLMIHRTLRRLVQSGILRFPT